MGLAVVEFIEEPAAKTAAARLSIPEPIERTDSIAVPVQMTHIALAADVVLVFASDRAARATDARALATAAEPLIRELESRGLIRAG